MSEYIECPGCGGKAAESLGLKPGDLMTASKVRHLDGTPYKGGEPLKCDSCGGVAFGRIFKLLKAVS